MSRLGAVRRFYETLSPATLAGTAQVYGEHAYFRDPFNEVRGVDKVERIFAHMFDTLQSPRFVVLDAFEQGDQAFLTWDFHFQRQGTSVPMKIHGSSHLRFAPDGRVIYHRDYWDAAEELWERVPVLGAVLRWLKGRLRVG